MLTRLLALFALSGCSVLTSHVEGWPTLETKVELIPDGAIYAKCTQDIPLWIQIVRFPLMVAACAEVNLWAGTCTIWATATTTEGTLEHERAHCAGWDHGAGMQELYDKWKARK